MITSFLDNRATIDRPKFNLYFGRMSTSLLCESPFTDINALGNFLDEVYATGLSEVSQKADLNYYTKTFCLYLWELV
jgi:hypothetical protein